MIFNEDGSITFDKYDNHKLNDVWRQLGILFDLVEFNPVVEAFFNANRLGDTRGMRPILNFMEILSKQVKEVVVCSSYKKDIVNIHVTENNWKPKEEKRNE